MAPDLGQLERHIDKKKRVWCGWKDSHGSSDKFAHKDFCRCPQVSGTVCCEQDVGVYVAPDLGQLERRIDKKERVWCGWEHFLGGPDNECTAHVNPFGQNFIAIADHRHKSLFSAGVPCQPDCSCHALG